VPRSRSGEISVFRGVERANGKFPSLDGTKMRNCS